MIEAMLQFGVAGLMGALWLWERSHSRRRERQLDEAHTLLTTQDRELALLMRLVRQNTKAIVGFERTQARICELLEGMRYELQGHNRKL